MAFGRPFRASRPSLRSVVLKRGLLVNVHRPGNSPTGTRDQSTEASRLFNLAAKKFESALIFSYDDENVLNRYAETLCQHAGYGAMTSSADPGTGLADYNQKVKKIMPCISSSRTRISHNPTRTYIHTPQHRRFGKLLLCFGVPRIVTVFER